MNEKKKITRFFSSPLMGQNIRSNRTVGIAVLVVMCLMALVINYAMSIMQTDRNDVDISDAQADFYSHLYVMASYNDMAGTSLSYDDFMKTADTIAYDTAFDMMNAQDEELNLSSEAFMDDIEVLESSGVSVDTYVRQFEYTYALGGITGCFDGEELDMEDLMDTMFEVMGIPADMMETMSEMDTSTMMNQMYFTIMGILPILIFIVLSGNNMFADQVDKGSMAYVLSTPIKRRAISITQAVFMIAAPLVIIGIVCCVKLGTSYAFYDEVNAKQILVLYLGMYILIEAIAGVCYLGSCLFSRGRNSLAFGGGLTVWFFIASLLGMFGSSNMVDMGMGVEQLGVFNNLTLIGLYDIDSISTIGTGAFDGTFIWKLVILGAVSLICYVVGGTYFQKKDLPL